MPTETTVAPDLTAFEAALRDDGYLDVQLREISAGTHNAAHSHPFDVRAVMLAGELALTREGRTQVYRAGEVFTMSAGCEHAEQFGDAPVRYLVGRRNV